MNRPIALALIAFIQSVCAVFFVSDLVISVFGIRTAPINWKLRELLEIGASVGLLLGMVLGWVAFRRTLVKSVRMERRLRDISAAFHDLLEQRFDEWGLTQAERDVALFALKGLSTQEIAALRNTSEGTVKAQSNAIYRKAGVSGRAQLLSLFIDDLMQDDLGTQPKA
ncbi:helix-turn-helix transcriptional regulator [Thalassovita sp.]|uniref:helix-turn-helix transcriptional regulator n=1 Tax=Thalassovita sp. TaxID=1979401 RepID=UPI0029DE8E4A|nr:helix-turn-helix transcriptional regulator [Thalassovita sp.]